MIGLFRRKVRPGYNRGRFFFGIPLASRLGRGRFFVLGLFFFGRPVTPGAFLFGARLGRMFSPPSAFVIAAASVLSLKYMPRVRCLQGLKPN